MDFDLNDSQRQARETAGRFVLREIEPIVDEWDREGRFHRELVRKMGAEGLFGSVFPEEVGGSGLGTVLSAGAALVASRTLSKSGIDPPVRRTLIARVPPIRGWRMPVV